jgi:hypothetical protein
MSHARTSRTHKHAAITEAVFEPLAATIRRRPHAVPRAVPAHRSRGPTDCWGPRLASQAGVAGLTPRASCACQDRTCRTAHASMRSAKQRGNQERCARARVRACVRVQARPYHARELHSPAKIAREIRHHQHACSSRTVSGTEGPLAALAVDRSHRRVGPTGFKGMRYSQPCLAGRLAAASTTRAAPP